MKLPPVPDPSELIPPSGVVRERLAEAICAERTLRKLLRVAVRAEQDRQHASPLDRKEAASA
jgi:hypothetical protein